MSCLVWTFLSSPPLPKTSSLPPPKSVHLNKVTLEAEELKKSERKKQRQYPPHPLPAAWLEVGSVCHRTLRNEK